MHRIYWSASLVQETYFGVPTRTRRLVGVRGRKLLAEQLATFRIHVQQPWRVALSAQIQTTIIPGEKMSGYTPGETSQIGFG